MTGGCTRCGSAREYPEHRFRVRLDDYGESTVHTSEHTLCVDCWEVIRPFVFGDSE